MTLSRKGDEPVYVCEVCGFKADEPKEHGYRYPRIPVPGFHIHAAATMKLERAE